MKDLNKRYWEQHIQSKHQWGIRWIKGHKCTLPSNTNNINRENRWVNEVSQFMKAVGTITYFHISDHEAWEHWSLLTIIICLHTRACSTISGSAHNRRSLYRGHFAPHKEKNLNWIWKDIPVRAVPKLVRKQMPSVSGIWFDWTYCLVLLNCNWIHLSTLMRALISATLHMLVRPSGVHSWTSAASAAVTCASRLGTDQTGCWWRWAQARAWSTHCVINCGYPLLPLLEAIITYPDPLPIFTASFGLIRSNRNWVFSTLGTENSSTQAAMVLAVKYGELWITFVADPAALIRHPKVLGQVCGFGPSRDPWFDHVNYLRQLIIIVRCGHKQGSHLILGIVM